MLINAVIISLLLSMNPAAPMPENDDKKLYVLCSSTMIVSLRVYISDVLTFDPDISYKDQFREYVKQDNRKNNIPNRRQSVVCRKDESKEKLLKIRDKGISNNSSRQFRFKVHIITTEDWNPKTAS